jgi:hypothetical protein
MDDTNQFEVPPSFLALYLHRSGDRLTQAPEVVQQRYELCEDLAQALAGQAEATLFKSAGSEAQVLAQIGAALSAEGSAVQPAEAAWVVARLAEVLGWDTGSG